MQTPILELGDFRLDLGQVPTNWANVAAMRQIPEADDFPAITRAAAASKVIFFPPGSFTNNTALVSISDQVVIGHKATLNGQGFISTAGKVELIGLEFVGQAIAGYLDVGLWIENCSDVSVHGCRFDRSRLFCRSTEDTDQYRRISIRENTFVGDYTGMTEPQAIYVAGFGDVDITDNKFALTAAQRYMKLTASESYVYGQQVGAGANHRMVVTGNNLKGTCTQQVIDLYAGAAETVISDNVVDVTGCTRVIEGKCDGLQGPQTAYQRNLNIHGNVLRTDANSLLMFQGAFGLAWENGTQVLKINNNVLRTTAAAPGTLIDLKGFHQVSVTDNDLNCDGDSDYLLAILLQTCKWVHIAGNHCNKGSIYVGQNGSTTTGTNYNGVVEAVNIHGNTLREFRHYAGVIIFSMTAARVAVSGNLLHTTKATGPASAVVYVRDSTLADLVVIGNWGANLTNDPFTRLQFVNASATSQTHHGNSWSTRVLDGAAAPVAGTWKKGDKVWNSAPAAGGKAGWVCVAGGTPGTWKPFGTIDA